MINTQLLDNKIEQSGLKIKFVIDSLGLSRQGFDMKRKGQTPFRVSEIYVLCDLLHISDNDKQKIFYPEG